MEEDSQDIPMISKDFSDLLESLRFMVRNYEITAEDAMLLIVKSASDLPMMSYVTIKFDQLDFILAFLDDLVLEKYMLNISNTFNYINHRNGVAFGVQ